jgi:hypothetical protein
VQVLFREEEGTESKRQQMAKEWDFTSNMRRKSSRLITQAKHNWSVWVYLLLEEPHSSAMAAVGSCHTFIEFFSPPDWLKRLLINYQ